MVKLDKSLLIRSELTEYFRSVYLQIQNNWNVESALEFIGVGRSNEGTDESKAIFRYYVKPYDKRFEEIYLNFNSDRLIESIVWFLDKDNSELINISQLKAFFGDFIIKNIIYDNTTTLTFFPTENKYVSYVRSTIPEWIEMKNGQKLYFKRGNNEFEIGYDYKLTSLIIKLLDKIDKT